MKANELRIGNFIKWISTGEIEVVKDIEVVKRKTGNVNNVSIADCAGVELTEEWLIKFGFAYDGDEWSNYNEEEPEDWHISLGDDRGDIYYTYEGGLVLSRYIESVHQLQNLYFALTGEELELKQ